MCCSRLRFIANRVAGARFAKGHFYWMLKHVKAHTYEQDNWDKINVFTPNRNLKQFWMRATEPLYLRISDFFIVRGRHTHEAKLHKKPRRVRTISFSSLQSTLLLNERLWVCMDGYLSCTQFTCQTIQFGCLCFFWFLFCDTNKLTYCVSTINPKAKWFKSGNCFILCVCILKWIHVERQFVSFDMKTVAD